MGQNPCKPLVEHGGRISEADLKALVERHDIGLFCFFKSIFSVNFVILKTKQTLQIRRGP